MFLHTSQKGIFFNKHFVIQVIYKKTNIAWLRMYIISAVIFEISHNSILKNSCFDLFDMFSLCEYLQGKVHYMLVSLPAVNIFLNQRPKILKPMWKWFSSERLFLGWKKFQTNRPFKILCIRDKYDSQVKINNDPDYSTNIYLNRKWLCFFRT